MDEALDDEDSYDSGRSRSCNDDDKEMISDMKHEDQKFTIGTDNSKISNEIITESQDDSDDMTIIYEGNDGSNSSTFSFTLSHFEWREYHSERLHLDLPLPRPQRTNSDRLSTPEILENVQGDGNCFFRAMSREISGSEHNHKKIRDAIVSFMLESNYATVFAGYTVTVA